MPPLDPQTILSAAHISPEIFALRPDYRALLLIATNIPPGPSDAHSEAYLSAAEASAKSALATTPISEIPHVLAWRETYKAFGAKPKKTLNSLEALLKRVDSGSGLPRVNKLTDIYNAVSIKYHIPIGGEDLDKYVGAPFLKRATGEESFITKSAGEEVLDHPKKGEVVWCDEEGVTCRLWNWRQCARTGLSGETRNVVFILDGLDGIGDEVLREAADELEREVRGMGVGVEVHRRGMGKEE